MTALPRPQSRILHRDAVLERYGRPRDGTLVLTNGVFDLLHRGHVDYLVRARELGDALVVGVNSDASARRLGKGTGRPFNSEEDRCYVLAGLACVDAVTVFHEDTPGQLIAALLPDVLVKGADYGPDDVVGRADVEAAGGELVILPLVEGRSTTDLVKRIREEGT